MKLLKSIRQHSRLLIGSLLTTLFLFVVLIGFLIYLQFSMGILESEYTRLINSINQAILLFQKDEPDLPEELEALTLDIADIREEAQHSRLLSLRWILPERRLFLPPRAGSSELSAFYKELLTYTKELRANKFRLLELEVRTIYIILVFLLLLIIFVSLLFLLYLRGFYRYTTSIERGIGQIDRHLNYQSTEKMEADPRDPLEIQEFFRTVNRIENDIDLDQFLDGIESYGRLSDVLEMVAPVIRKIIPFDRIALAFNDSNGFITAESAYTTYKDIYLDPGKSEPAERTSLPALAEQGTPRIIADLTDYALGNYVSYSTRLILKEGIRSSLTVPLLNHNRCIGFLFFSCLKPRVYSGVHLKAANRVANKLKHRFYNDFLIQEVIAETAQSFVALVNEKDNETSNHLDRMTRYSYQIARTLSSSMDELTPQLLREINWFAALHDIGKIGVPDAILSKAGPLTDREYEVMKQHVDLGEKILISMNANLDKILTKSLLKTAVEIIQGHHERFDGKGYPRGLKGEEIPLAGRIVAVADVFDALTSRRSYKKAFSIEKSLRIMEEDMAGAFDPEILQGLKESMEEIREIYDRLKEI